MWRRSPLEPAPLLGDVLPPSLAIRARELRGALDRFGACGPSRASGLPSSHAPHAPGESGSCNAAMRRALRPTCRVGVQARRSLCELPPSPQHWTRCDLGVTAGSRACIREAKLRKPSATGDGRGQKHRLCIHPVFGFISSGHASFAPRNA
jgi:hypothetical protein